MTISSDIVKLLFDWKSIRAKGYRELAKTVFTLNKRSEKEKTISD